MKANDDKSTKFCSHERHTCNHDSKNLFSTARNYVLRNFKEVSTKTKMLMVAAGGTLIKKSRGLIARLDLSDLHSTPFVLCNSRVLTSSVPYLAF